MSYRHAPAPRSHLSPIAVAAVLAVTGALLVAPAGAASADVPDTTLTDLTVRVLAPAKRVMAPDSRVGDGGPARSVVAVLPARNTAPYSTIGVTWTAASTPPQVQVRVKQQDWGRWQTLDNDEESGAAREGTAPVYVGESTGVEVRLLADRGAGAPRGVRVSLIDSPVIAADAHPQTMAAAPKTPSTSIPGMAPQPSIVSRKGWSADESWRNINKGCATPRIDQTIKAAIVHHTAGSNNYSAAQSASIVRGIYAFHVKSRGWCDVGYNFLVDRYGTIFEGRAGGVRLPVHGAHATEWNTNTVGVSFMGDFEAAAPPAGMLESGAKLIAWKLDGNYRDPLGRVTLAGKNINVISGHGDVLSTSCPGRNIRSRFGSFRSSVAAKVGSIQTPIQQRWLALGGDTGAAGSPHEPETSVASGRLTRFITYDIAWSASTGAKYVLGAIRNKYRAFGGPAGYLGFPTTDEQRGAPAGSSESVFARGRIQWTRSTGARAIIGGINNAYSRLSVSQRRSLGPAKADETKAGVAGSYRQLFTYGGIWWSSATSGHSVLGAIYARYAALGAEASYLRLPTAEATAVSGGGLRQSFQGGILTMSATGVVTAARR